MKASAVVSLLAALLVTPAYASTFVVGDGIEWSWTSADIGQSSGEIALHGDVSGSTLGDVRLAAFAFKSDSGIAVQSASVVGGGWDWKTDELSANGCSGGSHTFVMCFETGNIGASLTDASNIDLVVHFALASGSLPDVLHFKVDWNAYDPCASKNKGVCAGGWTKVGSLISQDVTVTETPVPGTLGLLGLGLTALGVVRRRPAASAG